MLDAHGLSDKGKKRTNNEDSLLINNALNLFIVADGMGGHLMGEVASNMAVTIINEFISKHLGKSSHLQYEQYITELLKTAVRKANKEIYGYSQSKNANSVMGTTVSLALVKDNKMFVAHVGDSTIHRSRNNGIEKLTRDHSAVQQLIDSGTITEDEGKKHALSHALTKAVGTGDAVEPDLAVFDIKEGDSVLLSSDGLMRVLDTEDIKNIISRQNSAEEKCNLLINKTLQGGAPDNVSVIVINYI